MMKQNKTSSELDSKTRSFYWVDSYANGISLGHNKISSAQDLREMYPLQLNDSSELARLRSRYALNKQNPLHELELNLMKLSGQGNLGSSIICLGALTDPFFPFEGKFHASLKFLELFTKYKPGFLMVQTRSPLIVLAMPVLRKLGKNVSVTMAVETHEQKVADRYTPDLPSIEERIKAASSLRNFGIEVNIQVSPLLPYGDWKADAPNFARFLVKHADYIHVMPLNGQGSSANKTSLTADLAKKLAFDRKFHWLRADSANPLITAIEELAPEKLKAPTRQGLENKQLDFFAA